MDRTSHYYPSMDIGDYTYGHPKILGTGQANLHIGKFCSISEGVTIFLGQEHRHNWITTYPFTCEPEWNAPNVNQVRTKGDVIIGNDVWIGYGVTILSGTEIKDGVCIGAMSVVASTYETEYTIIAGNPAHTIGYRFDDETCTELLKLAW